MRREVGSSGTFPESLALNDIFYIQKRAMPDWDAFRRQRGSWGPQWFPGLLDGMSLLRFLETLLEAPQTMQHGSPTLFSQGSGPHARDREATRTAHISPFSQSRQGICTMPFPCSERDGDSLAPGNQANGQESGVTGCSEGQGSLGTWGMWAEAGWMLDTCMFRSTVYPHQHSSGARDSDT